MSLKIENTMDSDAKIPLLFLVYGAGGSGKTTFATTAPNALIVDCEGGTKYLKSRGIRANVVNIKSWADMKEIPEMMKDFDTIVIDPIGELMEKLKRHMVGMRDKKLTQADGSPTAAGWGWLKDTLRGYIKILRDSGKHVLIVAHVEEKADGEIIVARPMVQTKLSEELVNMVDVVGFMTRVVDKNEDGDDGKDGEKEGKVIILVDANSDRYVAKDRTGQLGTIIEPDFSKIIRAVDRSEIFAWSSQYAKDVAAKEKKATAKAAPVETPDEDATLSADEIEEEMNPTKTAAKKTTKKSADAE